MNNSTKQNNAERRERIKKLISENSNITPYEIAIIENGSRVFANGSLAGKISRIKATIKLLTKEQNPERSDATDDDSSNAVGNQK